MFPTETQSNKEENRLRPGELLITPWLLFSFASSLCASVADNS